MSALEQEILQKFMELDEAAQQRIIQTAAAQSLKTGIQSNSWQTWLDETRQFRETLRNKYRSNTGIDVTAWVRELRDGDDEYSGRYC